MLHFPLPLSYYNCFDNTLLISCCNSTTISSLHVVHLANTTNSTFFSLLDFRKYTTQINYPYRLDFRKIHYKAYPFYILFYRFPVNIFLFYVITTTLASFSVAAISVSSPILVRLTSVPPRLAIRESHLCPTVSHLPASSLAPCPAPGSLIYPKSYPSLFVFLPTFLSWLIGHSSLPEFVSFDTTYSPSCYSTFSDNFLFSNSSLEFTTWRGSLSVLSIATALLTRLHLF